MKKLTKADKLIIDKALSILEEKAVYGDPITSPAATTRYLKLKLAGLEHEVFGIVFLDNRHRVLACEEMFRGTINGASVHPREVVKASLAHNAAAVILYHNHPSGVADPSQADCSITSRLKDALALIDVRLLDHFVFGDGDPVSMAEAGLI